MYEGIITKNCCEQKGVQEKLHSCTNKITKPWHSLTSYLSCCIAAFLVAPPLSCHTARSCHTITSLIAPCLSCRATPLSLCHPSLTMPPLSCRVAASLIVPPLSRCASPILSRHPLLLPPPLSSCHRLSCCTTPHSCRLVLCNWKYFGTYLGYLPTIPTLPQCDTFQLIPVSF
jgi:hypothetical protein